MLYTCLIFDVVLLKFKFGDVRSKFLNTQFGLLLRCEAGDPVYMAVDVLTAKGTFVHGLVSFNYWAHHPLMC